MAVPKSKPAITRARIEALLKKNDVDLAREKCVLIGIRGYYRDTMGKKGKNDIGIFDDAFVCIDGRDMASFNGNTDPSRYYKNVATLKTGKWKYKKGLHGFGRKTAPYPAYRQAAPVRVLRYQPDGTFKEFPLNETINIHRGGEKTTSSAGCQTLPPSQWPAFKAYMDMLLDRNGKKDFLYLVVENDGSIA